jgi:hypothetical protein
MVAYNKKRGKKIMRKADFRGLCLTYLQANHWFAVVRPPSDPLLSVSDQINGVILPYSFGGKAMRCLTRTAFLLFLLNGISQTAFSQLRNLSEYSQDRISTDKTYFVLQDTGKAEFGWGSEWTHMTVNANVDKSAMFLWYFKDGSKAYSLQAEDMGEIGKSSGFLLAGQSSNLEDIRRKKIQPLTRNNYPVKVELWIGKIDDSTGFSLEIVGDAVCLDAPGIEYNHSYHFSSCRGIGD